MVLTKTKNNQWNVLCIRTQWEQQWAQWTKAQQGKKYHSTCGLSWSSRLDWKLPWFLILWEINDEVFFSSFFSVLMIYLGSLAC